MQWPHRKSEILSSMKGQGNAKFLLLCHVHPLPSPVKPTSMPLPPVYRLRGSRECLDPKYIMSMGDIPPPQSSLPSPLSEIEAKTTSSSQPQPTSNRPHSHKTTPFLQWSPSLRPPIPETSPSSRAHVRPRTRITVPPASSP